MEITDSENLDTIGSRHRKEKKELQAQIQALKKSAKNDKTRKKEILTEITRMEAELTDRHSKELEHLQTRKQNNSNVEITPEIEETATNLNMPEDNTENNTNKKLSKAQKRRDKKMQREKERDEQIKLQEKENINGPRNVEMQSICAKLKNANLKLYPIPSDGDCLYKAVGHQLQLTRNKLVTIDELRKTVASYMKENKDDFIPFMSHPETFEMLTNEEFKQYCDKISNTKVWGGQLEIRALSNSLRCPISVIQATGPSSIEQGTEFDGPPLIITYHRVMYSLGEHFNSTCCNDKDEEVDESKLV